MVYCKHSKSYWHACWECWAWRFLFAFYVAVGMGLWWFRKR